MIRRLPLRIARTALVLPREPCRFQPHALSQSLVGPRYFSTEEKLINVTFIDGEKRIQVQAKEGESILHLAHECDVDLEGACEGSLACSTCHVILQKHVYDGLPEPTDEENDMLDLAFGLTDTSRLGCQVKISSSFEGAEIKLPAATRNMAVDGHKSKR
eukprot:c47565_g1_i1.p1 GENE.c47565_g1_i1~~c47565_g1_i1.p1  ORF type:complete len:171 (+),score=26.14 c47565_g1_i1:39-515(+)